MDWTVESSLLLRRIRACTQLKLPLQNWIYAIYSIMTARKGVSAMQISKELGISYKAAWYMLHRIREGLCERRVQAV